MRDHATAFAPATLANLGPGFDVLGLALADIGDTVTAHRVDGPLRIESIEGDHGRLPRGIDANTAGIAARETLRHAGLRAQGVALTIRKGLPIGSGLGSSAASAAAAAWAINALLETPLAAADLIEPCLAAEEAVSGRHADNLAPALLGGLVLVRRLDPLDWVRVPTPQGLSVVVVTPAFELKTQVARKALPLAVTLPTQVRQSADLGALIAAGFTNDAALFGRALNDGIATPARLPLIPGGPEAILAAREAGALGAGISGAGPSIFAIVETDAERVGAQMQAAFAHANLTATVHHSPLDAPGARLL
jgi:homoserine kinase